MTLENKIRLIPELLTDDDKSLITDEDKDEYHEYNEQVINNYFIPKILEALIYVYMDPNNRSHHSLCSMNNDVYYKLDNNNKEADKLSRTALSNLMSIEEDIDDIVFVNFNSFILKACKSKLFEFDYTNLRPIISSKLEELLLSY